MNRCRRTIARALNNFKIAHGSLGLANIQRFSLTREERKKNGNIVFVIASVRHDSKDIVFMSD